MVFTTNRERLLDGNIAEAFFQAVLKQACERNLLSDGHFTGEGTLRFEEGFSERMASSRLPADDPGNATVDFHGKTIEPDA